MTTNASLAAKTIQSQAPDFHPRVGIVLGSGLGEFANQLENRLSIPYETLPGFPHMTVKGHSGQLVLGTLSGVPVVCLKGRSHAYEGLGYDTVKTYVRTLKLLGCEYFIATNASGSLHADVGPGELMLITDHLNFQGSNPLIGPNDDDFGPRFFPLDKAYDKTLREHFLSAASSLNLPLHEGVYGCVMGPNYETAAEIKAFKTLGVDAVGMSTVPEILVATHCGMKVAVIASITNFATGLASTSHDHAKVVEVADKATVRLGSLLTQAIGRLA